MQPETTRIIFCKNLNRLFEDTGRMQADLADFLGVHFTTVSDWKRGKSIPRTDKLRKIAEFFNVPEASLTSPTIKRNSKVEPTDVAITGLIEDIFADEPEILKLLKNGVYTKEGELIEKQLKDISPNGKEFLKDIIKGFLKSEGLL